MREIEVDLSQGLAKIDRHVLSVSQRAELAAINAVIKPVDPKRIPQSMEEIRELRKHINCQYVMGQPRR
jgi:hypothetical protein